MKLLRKNDLALLVAAKAGDVTQVLPTARKATRFATSRYTAPRLRYKTKTPGTSAKCRGTNRLVGFADAEEGKKLLEENDLALLVAAKAGDVTQVLPATWVPCS